MKTINIIIMLVMLMLAFSLVTGVAFAQDEAPELPPTAVEGVGVLAVFLTGLLGLLSNRIVEFISNLGFLSGEDKEKLRQPVLDFVAAAGSVAIGYVVAFLTPLAQMMDDLGLWAIVLAVWPVAYGWYLLQKATGPKRETIIEV